MKKMSGKIDTHTHIEHPLGYEKAEKKIQEVELRSVLYQAHLLLSGNSLKLNFSRSITLLLLTHMFYCMCAASGIEKMR